MAPAPGRRTVVGIDVGGRRKGFHAVALRNGAYAGRRRTRDVLSLVTWCRDDIGAQVVAVDAPCRWSDGPGGRAAERELWQEGTRCFVTPTRREALRHAAGFYDWMFNGEALFRALEGTYSLPEAGARTGRRCCFETFPHAITRNLRGGNADSARKRAQRTALLREHGCRTDELTNMDWIDAALCALAAALSAAGAPLRFHGDACTGFIVVPPRAAGPGSHAMTRSPLAFPV